MYIDIIAAIIAALGFYWGFSKGIIRTVATIAALFFGFLLAVRFSGDMADLLVGLFNTEPGGIMPLMGFVVTFILVLLVLRLLAMMIEKVLTAMKLNVLNQLAGGLVTATLGLLLMSFGVMALDSMGVLPLRAKTESVTYESLEALPEQASVVLGKARPALEKVKDASKQAIEQRDASSTQQ